MSANFLLDQRSVAFAEDYIPAPDHVRNARDTAVSSGAPAPSNSLTTTLTFLVSFTSYRIGEVSDNISSAFLIIEDRKSVV